MGREKNEGELPKGLGPERCRYVYAGWDAEAYARCGLGKAAQRRSPAPADAERKRRGAGWEIRAVGGGT